MNIGMVFGVVIDLWLTALLTYYLHKHKTAFRRYVYLSSPLPDGDGNLTGLFLLELSISWSISSTTQSTLVHLPREYRCPAT